MLNTHNANQRFFFRYLCVKFLYDGWKHTCGTSSTDTHEKWSTHIPQWAKSYMARIYNNGNSIGDGKQNRDRAKAANRRKETKKERDRATKGGRSSRIEDMNIKVWNAHSKQQFYITRSSHTRPECDEQKLAVSHTHKEYKLDGLYCTVCAVKHYVVFISPSSTF